MDKIDLIIEFCESMANMHVKGSVHALAAAYELKSLKPVAIVDHSHPFSDDSVYMIANYERSLPSGTKLYALDGEQT